MDNMENDNSRSLLSYLRRLKMLVIGKAKDPTDSSVFHKLSLIAFFAWVGLGSDGLSSCCYGPEEAFLALKGHTHLAVLVALATAVTIFIISTSYSQIIELFPSGGGGYVVATKLLSPTVGMVSGSALLIDYVLTIAISVASGVDAFFSFLPMHLQFLKLGVAVLGVAALTVLNLRGIKESVTVLLPVFLIFVLTHVCGIGFALFSHAPYIGEVSRATVTDFKASYYQLGLFGVLFVLMRAYSMGAGTYTGIEAVSNGVSILREPKVQTAKKTMVYMAVSLAFVVVGIMFAYLLYGVQPQSGKTLNAVLFQSVFGQSNIGYAILILTLLSEAAILFVAAQTGFLGGPGVIANMAIDHWFPARFAMLSDRLVTQNGVLLMGGAAIGILFLSRGKVSFLVVLYSINVFITFALSQLGMVRHWWKARHNTDGWQKKLTINGLGLILTGSILISVVVIKFFEGGWITLLITGALVAVVVAIKRHYRRTRRILRRLDQLLVAVTGSEEKAPVAPALAPKYDRHAKTAILMVNGFNGLGLHTLFGVFRLFKGVFKNFVIVQVGVIDAGAFKGADEVERLKEHIHKEVGKYVAFIQKEGYYAEGISLIGVDVIDEITQAAPDIMKRFPDAIFFGGQLVFPEELFMSRWLHNYTVFAIQRKFYYQGIPVVLLPIRL